MLEEKEFEFVIGCCLGDGSLNSKNKRSLNPVFSMSHTISQEAYIRWKAEKLNQILQRNCTVRAFNVKLKGKEYPTFGYGVSSPELWKAHNLLYKEGKKTFTWELLKPLGLQALALFWMDDGGFITRFHTTKTNRSLAYGQPGLKGLQRKYFREARLSLYTDEKEAKLVRAWIKWLTGAEGYLYDPKNNGQYIIVWHKEDFLRIVTRIKSFVHPSMYRKISLDGQCFHLKPVTVGEGESAAKLIGDD